MDSLPLKELALKAPSFIPNALSSHNSGLRVNTSNVITTNLTSIYPSLHLTVCPTAQIDLLSFAREGHATVVTVSPETVIKKHFVRGATRILTTQPVAPSKTTGTAEAKKKNGDEAEIVEDVEYGKYLLIWEGHEFLVFIVDCLDTGRGSVEKFNHILAPRPEGWTHSDKNAYQSTITHALMLKVAEWMMQTLEHVLVFDEGRWKKNQKLWEVTQRASWDNVVLNEEMKESLKTDVEGFFESKSFYEGFNVPWKRGIIFHGPPGNGKTLAIQSLMKGLYTRADPIPTLYVKSFAAENGAQWSIRQVFKKARVTAPCLLVFEDIDSMITDTLRSYFLNEVDGLESNDGIFMLGTTNHLERLDPALAQRPSRFDRKIHFERPNHKERVMYVRFWGKNIPGTNAQNFSDALCEAIADVTDSFSFAYLKELFLATLLGMAREGVALEEDAELPVETAEEDEVLVSKPGSSGASVKDEGDEESEEKEAEEKKKTYPSLAKSVLWPRIKAQAEILRTAIVSEEKAGTSYAATGEKGVMGDEEDEQEVRRVRMHMSASNRRRMFAR